MAPWKVGEGKEGTKMGRERERERERETEREKKEYSISAVSRKKV